MMKDKELEKAAAALYEPKLPYHNFGHAITVTRYSERIIDRCREEGVPLDERVVYYALIFHDAGYHEDHVRLDFNSKEAYSAHLAEQTLAGHGVEQAVIERVKEAILSTHMDATCRSNEDKAVRASDLSGLAADYEVFKNNAVKLKEEFELMNDTTVSWSQWKSDVKTTLDKFLDEELELTSDYYDSDGRSVFHQRARANIETLLADENP